MVYEVAGTLQCVILGDLGDLGHTSLDREQINNLLDLMACEAEIWFFSYMEASDQAAAKAPGAVSTAPSVFSAVLCGKVRCMFHIISSSNVAWQKIWRERMSWVFVWGRQKTRYLVGGREQVIRDKVWPKQGCWELSSYQEESWTTEDQGLGRWEQASDWGVSVV